MRFRGSVAIDLGTVNTLVWVAGRGIVLEEPTAIAIDTGVGKVAAVGEAADALADKEPQDIQVIHPLRDGVIADLDATAAMLHARPDGNVGQASAFYRTRSTRIPPRPGRHGGYDGGDPGRHRHQPRYPHETSPSPDTDEHNTHNRIEESPSDVRIHQLARAGYRLYA